MQELIHEYNEGTKTFLIANGGKKGIQLKVTQHHVEDVKQNVRIARQASKKDRLLIKTLQTSMTKDKSAVKSLKMQSSLTST